MLRVSAMTTETEIDLQSINGSDEAAAVGIGLGPELIKFAKSAVHHDVEQLAADRQRLLETAGPEVVVDAAGVVANFQRMVRIADSIGIAVDDMESELGQEVRRGLELERFPSAQNTLAQ
jgi:hypothetical protein